MDFVATLGGGGTKVREVQENQLERNCTVMTWICANSSGTLDVCVCATAKFSRV